MSSMGINEVLKYLPHRYPFLLIDRVLEYNPGKSMKAVKNVSFNEPFFPGHFPQGPVMPGVMIVEAMAQASALLGLMSYDKLSDDSMLYYLVGIDNARFKRPVVPGDQLIIDVVMNRVVKGVSKFGVKGSVDDSMVASADIIAALRKREN